MELFHHLMRNDFRTFAMVQLAERKGFHYPPYTRLIEIALRCTDRDILDRAAETLAGMLRNQSDLRFMGPEYPLISRIRNSYVKRIILKIDKDKSVARVKDRVRKCLGEMHTKGAFRSVRITVDVDPV
jgi:primosomal protein N' (replication factor Y)